MVDVTKIALENLDETFLKNFDLLPNEFDGEVID